MSPRIGTYLISTQPGPQPCRRCGELVLAAWAEGVLVAVDPRPLTEAGEHVARLYGRGPYDLARTELVERNPDRARSPAKGPVLAAHRCNDPPIGIAEVEPGPPILRPDPDEIPF